MKTAVLIPCYNEELPIKYSNRPQGSKSKLKTIQDGAKIIKYIFIKKMGHSQEKTSHHAPIQIIKKFILTFLILIIGYIIALTATSCFSSEHIKQNVQQSSQILLDQMSEETEYRLLLYMPYRMEKVQFDNPTDALMVNTAYSINYKTPFLSAMLARKNYVENITTQENGDTNGRLISSNQYGVEYHPIKELHNIANDNPDESFEYSRYWHGYLTILRPLLLLFNINTIRVILVTLICGLLIYVLKLIYQKLGIGLSIVFFIAFLLTEMFVIGISLQGSPIVIIMLISAIRVLKNEKISMLNFMIIGSLTNFFDFLTAPIITLAIPLILDILIKQNKNNYTIKEYLKMICIPSTIWLLGYAGTWIAKWIIVQLFCNRNMFETAFEQIKYRSFNTQCTYYLEFACIFKQLLNGIPVIVFVMFIFMIYVLKNLYNCSKNKNASLILKNNLKHSIPFIVISLFPFIWGLVLKNHTYHHAFFTYRILMIFVICLGIIMNKISIKNDKK